MRIMSAWLFPEDCNFVVLWIGIEAWVFTFEVARLRL